MKQELKPSIRINFEAKKKLESLQFKTKRSQTALLDRAVELLSYEVLSQQMADDLADLSSNPKDLASYKSLSEVLDKAAGDDLRKK
jgi:hypothetical protein